MSVQIKLIGDGSYTSSVAFTTLTLPVAIAPLPAPADNVEVIEGDSGSELTYERGIFRMDFAYLLTLLSTNDLSTLTAWWKTMRGRLHWCTLFAHDYPLAVDSVTQAYSTSTTIIQSALLNQAVNFWVGWWAMPTTGVAVGQHRKIISSNGTNQVVVDPAFDNAVVSGNTVVLGYPVRLADGQMPNPVPQSHNAFEIQLNLLEKVMS